MKTSLSMWSFLSVNHPLQIPNPMYEKKIWVRQENLYKITYCLRVFPTYFLQYTRRSWMGSRNLSKTVEKSSSSPRAAGVRSAQPSPRGHRPFPPSFSKTCWSASFWKYRKWVAGNNSHRGKGNREQRNHGLKYESDFVSIGIGIKIWIVERFARDCFVEFLSSTPLSNQNILSVPEQVFISAVFHMKIANVHLGTIYRNVRIALQFSYQFAIFISVCNFHIRVTIICQCIPGCHLPFFYLSPFFCVTLSRHSGFLFPLFARESFFCLKVPFSTKI